MCRDGERRRPNVIDCRAADSTCIISGADSAHVLHREPVSTIGFVMEGKGFRVWFVHPDL